MMKRAVVISALWTLGIGTAMLLAIGCGTGAPRDGSAGDGKAPAPAPAEEKAPAPATPREPAPTAEKALAETATAPPGHPTDPAPAGQPAPGGDLPPKPAETPVPAVAHEPAPVSKDPSATSPSAGGAERILPTTRRSAAGLPEAIAGYISWFRLGPSATPDLAGKAHAPQRQAYVLFPKQENHELGGTVRPPFETDTVIVLEEKEPGKDFISRVRTMTREEKGWKFTDHGRAAAEREFTARAGAEAECAACHAKARDSDSVHSSLKLE